MIVERLREIYQQSAQTRLPTGNPSGSRFGQCTAQLQFLISGVTPADWQVRALMVFEAGHMFEEWWATQIRRCFPNPYGFGLRHEPFYFPVELDQADTDALERLFVDKARWGRVVADFRRPEITMLERRLLSGEVERRIRLRHSLPRDMQNDPRRAERWGFILDAPSKMLYAPVEIDFMVHNSDLGRPAVLEAKSMSNWAFRRALVGTMGYNERCQLVGEAIATNCDVAWLINRKETSHILELGYTRAVDRVHVDIIRTNGMHERFIGGLPSKRLNKVLREDGTVVDIPDDKNWEFATVWTPWDDQRLVEDIQQRIRLALLASPDEAHRFKREWGPEFTCQECDGTGREICSYCDGTRASKRSSPPGKLCGACIDSQGLPSTRECTRCKGEGEFDETTLPQFPCGYCPVNSTCYGSISRLDLTEETPRYIVTRADWIRSGLSFERPRFA